MRRPTIVELAVVAMVVGFMVYLLFQKPTSRLGPLCMAASRGEVARLLEKKLAKIDEHDGRGRNALCYAACYNRTDVARLLIEKGFDVHDADRDAKTPLHAAASCGGLDVIRSLLENGADVNARDRHSMTPLDCVQSRLLATSQAKADREAQHKGRDRLGRISTQGLRGGHYVFDCQGGQGVAGYQGGRSHSEDSGVKTLIACIALPR